MTTTDQSRYSRQIRFHGVGAEGQSRLGHSRVAIVGCGALGSSLAELLVRAGIGTVRLIDRDFVDISNLQRQALFTETDVALHLPKAVAAANHLATMNNTVVVEPIVADLQPHAARELLGGVDLILDGTDNFETRFLMNDASLELKTPWIYGGVVGSEGQTTTLIPGETACFRCVMDTPPPAGASDTCDTAGVIAPAVRLVTAWQATAALQLLMHRPVVTAGRLLVTDLWEGTQRMVSLMGLKERGCPACRNSERLWLSGQHSSQSTVLCGRNAVQVTPAVKSTIDLKKLAEQWATAGTVTANPFLIRVRLTSPSVEVSVFRDGRAIIQGTDDPAVARSLYAQYVGS